MLVTGWKDISLKLDTSWKVSVYN